MPFKSPAKHGMLLAARAWNHLGMKKFTLLIASGLGGLLIIYLLLFPWIEGRILASSKLTARIQLDLVAESLNQRVKRFAPLPQLIAQQGSLVDLLNDPENAGLVPFVNEQLRLQAINTGAADVFLMDQTGLTIASSNYRTDRTFLGQNFSYRPYFAKSLAGAASQFHALGTTSGERGFFFAAPVLSETEVLGVLAVKITVDEIDAPWAGLAYETLVADANGVVFMASRPDWHFRTLAPLTAAQSEAIAQSRQYPADLMTPLGNTAAIMGEDRVQLAVTQAGRTDLYYAQSKPIALRGWHVIELTPASLIRTRALVELLYWCMSALIVLLLAYIFWQRQRQRAVALQRQKVERAILEQRVQERTVELHALNGQLVEKIEEQQRTEGELRQTQKELVQAGKLASLGQMSAALSHEINQPLAAIRSYAGNAVDFLDKERTARARENIVYISDMADRIARISKHLTNFARRSGDTQGPVSVRDVIAEAIALVQPKMREAGAEIAFTQPEQDCKVIGGPLRLQQVMINLLSNAIDAAGPDGAAKVEVNVDVVNDIVSILVRDNGTGVAPHAAEQIFDPFYSTKEAGQGMGLGLSISFNIIEDFGGKISVSNHIDGGAIFRVDLQRSYDTAKVAE